MKKALLVSIIAAEFLAIAAISLKIAAVLRGKKGAPVVINISKEMVLGTDSGSLRFFFEPAPLSTVTSELKPPWLPYDYTEHINADALNENRDYTPEKPPGIYRIMTLGDSFTYGLFVDTRDNWTELLESRLNAECGKGKFEVINLGVSGYDTEYSEHRFSVRGEKYHPDLVIWLFQNNDFTELSEFMLEKEKFYISDMKRTGEWDRLVKEGIPYPPAVNMTRDMEAFTKDVGKQRLAATQQGFIMQFLNEFRGTSLFSTFEDTDPSYKQILRAFSGPHVSFLELPDLKRINGATFMPNDYHPSKEGHRIIADAMFRFLTEKSGTIPCAR